MIYASKTREQLQREELEMMKKQPPGFEKVIFIIILVGLYILYYMGSARTLEGNVVEADSGDEIVVNIDGKNTNVRLRDVYSPAVGQSYFKEARDFTKKLTMNQLVTIRYHGRQAKKDRLLADVYLENGTELKYELVKNGWAWRWKLTANWELFKLEREARKKKIGLWKGKKPIPPWEWANTKENK